VATGSASAVTRARATARPWLAAWIDPSRLVWGVAATVLLLMVVLPLGWIVVASLRADRDESWTLANYLDAFASAR